MSETITKDPVPTIIIEPPKRWVPVNWREIWEYRELLYFFVWRDLKVRYKQTAIGVSWVVIKPFFSMVVFTLFFGNVLKVPSDGVPYAIFSFAGILPWNLFADGLGRSTGSMLENAGILTKVYIPRLILPIASVISPVVDFFVALVIFILIMPLFHYVPTVNVVAVPLFIAFTVFTALSLGLWLASFAVKYRDIIHAVPFLIQIGFFVSPVIYPVTILPPSMKFLYSLNPMAGIIDGFRWAFLGTAAPGPSIFISLGVVIVMFISGLFFFRSVEQYFADIV